MAPPPPNAAAAGQIVLGDLTVNRLGFGAMRITGPGIWGRPADDDLACRVLKRVVQLGVNFIDTADSYGPEVSEELIARALHPYPPGLVIATKGGLTRPGPDVWKRNGRPEHLRAACEGSLQRLRLERIDLYQLHAPDPEVPYEESLGELVRLQQEGKIRHIGVSNVSMDELRRAQAMTPIVSVQNRYNIEERGADAVLKYCEGQSIAFLPWAPLSSGKGAVQTTAKKTVQLVARGNSMTVAQVSIAWLLKRARVILPIPGTCSLQHAQENIAAGKFVITPEAMRGLG